MPNLKRAWLNFSEDMFENCSKPSEMKSISFALCYFHAAMLERKKFGVGNLPGASSGIGAATERGHSEEELHQQAWV